MSDDTTFYVYILYRPDGRPFYVGKESVEGRRKRDHEQEAKSGHACHKCFVIRKIWRSGGNVVRETMFKTGIEQDAYTEEKRLIALYGRETLTNIAPGGEGLSSPGEKNGQAKLTQQDVDAIRLRFATEITTLKELASEYGVTYRTVVSVVRQEHWGEDSAQPRTRTTEQRRALRSGERSAVAKMTMDQVHEIRRRYAAGEASARQIAKDYGVNQTCISDIVGNVTYHDPSYDDSAVLRNQVIPDRTGENAPTVKLDWESVRAIRQRYATGEHSLDLASEYGVFKSTLVKIIANRTWIDPLYTPPTTRTGRTYRKTL